MTATRTEFNYPLLLIASDDPYPTYKWMRDEDPAHYSRTEAVWVLTRYADVSNAFKDWKTWSSQRRGNLLNDLPERVGKTLGTTDPPRHTFARGIVNTAFTPKTVAGLTGTINRLARQLCEQARAKGTIEFVADLSAPYNAALLGAMFGVPESDFIQLRHWLDDFFRRDPPAPGQEPVQVVAMRHLREYMLGLAQARQARPADDLLTAMLQADENGQRLELEQVVVTSITFLVAGFESTNNLFTNLAHALGTQPQLLATLRAQPELVPNFVDEGMRWDAAAQGFVRSPTRAVELHGRVIPESAQVLLHIGSANRDERQFDDPDVFDLHRPNLRHLGFGQGVHFCVGAPLAREMTNTLFSTLVAASTAWEVDRPNAVRVTTPNFRGFSRLPIRIQP